MKKIKNKIFRKSCVFFLILTLLAMSAASGFVLYKPITISKHTNPQTPAAQPLDDPFFTWEDLFNTEENIDPYCSYDYEEKHLLYLDRSILE